MSSSAPAGSPLNDKNEKESPYMPSQDTITALGSGSWAELMMKQERPRMPVDRLINHTMQQAKAKNMNKVFSQAGDAQCVEHHVFFMLPPDFSIPGVSCTFE